MSYFIPKPSWTLMMSNIHQQFSFLLIYIYIARLVLRLKSRSSTFKLNGCKWIRWNEPHIKKLEWTSAKHAIDEKHWFYHGRLLISPARIVIRKAYTCNTQTLQNGLVSWLLNWYTYTYMYMYIGLLRHWLQHTILWHAQITNFYIAGCRLHTPACLSDGGEFTLRWSS